MKKQFQDQFDNLRMIIKTNVETLKNLLDQSDRLSEIIRELKTSEQNGKNSELKDQLELLKDNISKAIAELTHQTEQLFDSYNKLVDGVFGKNE